MNTHLAEDRGCETCDDPATEADRELGGTAQRAPRLLRHCAEGELVAELVHRELPYRVRDLFARCWDVVTSQQHREGNRDERMRMRRDQKWSGRAKAGLHASRRASSFIRKIDRVD